MARKRQMVLFSGGGWHYRGFRGWLMDEWLLSLTGKTRPNVCLLATPAGDSDHQFTQFHKFLSARANITWAPLFQMLDGGADATENILGADLVYLPGGYAQGAVAALRAAGWDTVLRSAWEDGVVIAGMCAGAMTFCAAYANRWQDRPGFGEGFGFQPVSFTAHAQHVLYEPVGSIFRHGIRDGLLPAGYQLQDGFALRFSGTQLAECVTTEPSDARGWYIEPTISDDGEPQIIEHELYAEKLEERLRLDESRDETAQSLSERERRSRLRRPLEPKHRPLDAPVAVTASIASPLTEEALATAADTTPDTDVATEDPVGAGA